MPLRLDLVVKVLFTLHMLFTDTHVKCQLIETLDLEIYLENMARQRRVGANGSCTV